MFRIYLILLISFNACNGLTGEEAVKRFFEYFRAENPIGIPVLNLSDPFEIYSPLETVPITVIGGRVSGHPKVGIRKVILDFLSLTGDAEVTAPRIELLGNYTWPGIYYTSEGFMNATLINITASTNFTMFIDEHDVLSLTDMQINQQNEEVLLDLTNLLWVHELVVSSGAIQVFFDDIVVELFRQLRPFLMSEVNREVSDFIATLPPVDSFMTSEDKKELSTSSGDVKKSRTFAILFNRLCLYMGMEPLHLPDTKSKMLGVKFTVTNLKLEGLSTVNKINALNIIYFEKSFFVELSMSFPILRLFYDLEIHGGKFGNIDMSEKVQLNEVDFKVKLDIDPSLKVPPQIKYFDIDIGTFGKIRSSSRSFWSRMKRVFSSIQNTIMREIVNALQKPIKNILQEQLNKADIEKSILKLLEKKT